MDFFPNDNKNKLPTPVVSFCVCVCVSVCVCVHVCLCIAKQSLNAPSVALMVTSGTVDRKDKFKH